MVTLAVSSVCAQDSIPLFEREPFDRLTLSQQYGGKRFEVFSIPRNELPPENQRTKPLRVRLKDRPTQEYDIDWKDIAKYERFEDIVFDAAKALIANKRFDEAFEHLAYLHREYANLRGLDESKQKLLFEEARASFTAGRWEDALVQLNAILEVSPNDPSILTALAAVNRRLLDSYLRQGQYAAVRLLLDRLSTEEASPELTRLRKTTIERLSGLAEKELTSARTHLERQEYRQAYEAVRRSTSIWSEVQGGQELLGKIYQQYPMIAVAVTETVQRSDAGRIDSWAARRLARLESRAIMELIGIGPEGGQYLCPIGTFTLSETGRQFTLQLRHLDPETSAIGLTGFDVSRQLLDMADAGQRSYIASWNRLLGGVSVSDVYDVVVDLSQRHLRIESLLRQEVSPSEQTEHVLSPYLRKESRDGQVSFLANPNYLLATPTQPREIMEVQFHDSAEAITALQSGAVDMIDRIFPSDVLGLQSLDEVILQPYAIPSLHMLIPNPDKTYTGNRKFRRAITYAINRPLILNQEILGGSRIEGCRVISGPFAPGRNRDDPIGYAYDFGIAPRPYDPELAFILAEIAVREIVDVAEKANRETPPKPELTLVHPESEIARIACERIGRQLTALSIPCRTVALNSEQGSLENLDWDLRYAEVLMAEPVTDAVNLLGPDGLASGGSPYLAQALRRLESADTWESARMSLLQIHQLAHQEVAVLPLWQIMDHCAFRKGIQGLSDGSVTLYQDVESWRVPTGDAALR